MKRRWLVLPLLAVPLAGCGQLGYLSQSLGGHLRLVGAARPVDEVLQQQDLAPRLRERLLLSQRMRDFAVSELRLPDNNSYRRYADLKRSAAVWNVVATAPLSLELKTWCFPIMGCVGYRGYFDEAEAKEFGVGLREQGLETLVYGVPAYSTLGWSSWLGGDPLLNTFIGYPEGELARMVFHELAHQVAYAGDDTGFNEAYATAVERLGGERWLKLHATEAERARDVRAQKQRAEFRALVAPYREQLLKLYAGREADKPARKAEIYAAMRADYQRLKQLSWAGDSRYDRWFAEANNASLALMSAYDELVPAFEALFHRLSDDWPRFHAEVRRLAALPKSERRAALAASQ
ncbi:aminopeptidase [Pelomonas sp. SE-A7]|uniref:aminopeptidase n=1 Tax=Pelomonas sp. SE-A7 TaxID=3054953 RepID=UPI00259C7327|nr:aminopeptidase [Pelomonas sp. SE-A7]MDM4767743.1 aminopeptidase [Pelomonas sp. SE-A7]